MDTRVDFESELKYLCTGYGIDLTIGEKGSAYHLFTPEDGVWLYRCEGKGDGYYFVFIEQGSDHDRRVEHLLDIIENSSNKFKKVHREFYLPSNKTYRGFLQTVNVKTLGSFRVFDTCLCLGTLYRYHRDHIYKSRKWIKKISGLFDS